ncbi:hypothetical protein K438DRAFT_1780877 [Mycena galopus ATCC 62051]|nr:hypothetical protein K438DRAFT_1780877 [Mycena galopus ATCC 62051]
MDKQHVLLLGASGVTGGSILQGLLEDTNSFDVEALVRPSSVAKPEIKKLADRGIKIRVGDIEGPVEALVDILAGIDVLISAIDPISTLSQIRLATAAKEAGVKRFVPCAFMTVAPPGGVMTMRDRKFWQNAESPQKEEVYQHIRKLYLPYTIIDVGYWHQISFPTLPSGRVNYASLFKSKTTIHNGGSVPTMLTDLRDIGRFVALIVKDARTLNKFIFTYGDLLSENEIFEIIEAMSGEKIERKYVSADEITKERARLAPILEANPNDVQANHNVFGVDTVTAKWWRGAASGEKGREASGVKLEKKKKISPEIPAEVELDRNVPDLDGTQFSSQ